jgi:plastocyanin
MVMKCYTPALLTALAVISMVPLVDGQARAIVVRMTQNKTFEPKTITVKVGDTVVWKNVSDSTHSVTDVSSLATTAQDASLPSGAKEFNSGLMPPGKEYSHTFTVTGTYKYFCIPHEEVGMVGTVIVSK